MDGRRHSDVAGLNAHAYRLGWSGSVTPIRVKHDVIHNFALYLCI